MAIMIPRVPHDFAPESREGEMFKSLSKLSDEYYVFHSFKMIRILDNAWKEAEIDFLIFNKTKGLLVIEAKAGHVSCVNGIWKYSSGDNMSHDPFQQASNNMWKLSKNIDNLYGSRDITNHCKRLFAVWFPSLTKNEARSITFPMGCDKQLLMTSEDLDDPSEVIERIFDIKAHGNVEETSLNKHQIDFLMTHVLCPSFNILPKRTLEVDYKNQRFDDLIHEQCRLLDYLEFQRNAVINGAAGTGKTMIAVEKARRHGSSNESVLFLCFNVKLKEHLENSYAYPNVKYYTMPGFAMSICGTAFPDYDRLVERLIDYVDSPDDFPYQHIVIDEGQDFGQENMNSDDVFDLLETIALSGDIGTFYIFYDKNQLVQGKEVPKFIENADCKLTLYKNCRNTQKIADTSTKPLIDFKPKLFGSAMEGVFPEIAFVSDDNKKVALDAFIAKLLDEKITNIQILSCSAEGFSIFDEYINQEKYLYRGMRIPFTTCRKFKGLEADAIILVDANKYSIMDNAKLFYVGASRARLQLKVLADLSDIDCREVIEYLGSTVRRNNPFATLTSLLGCDRVNLGN